MMFTKIKIRGRAVDIAMHAEALYDQGKLDEASKAATVAIAVFAMADAINDK